MKRFKLLLLALGITAVAVLGFGRVASAEGEADISHASHECVEILEGGGTIDDCQAAPNQLLPEKNEMIWGAVAFAVVFVVLWKLGMPAIKAGMQARSDKIEGDLNAAEAQRTEASEILAQYQAQLADARTESARIIEEARQAADDVRANLQAKAEADISELRARATADIESAKQQAVADLRGEVTALAIGAAEQVVGRNLDAETNAALVEAYINQVGANS
ncbi:MAG TPA: F0F1 ATP synthase subunit B [Acidimicrobiales bacterium]|jgi:F-type H+-transporting ATPase subunit b|nr:F0F1 ATP synthase subunit B [Acidimicrobiales bacterium]